MAYAVHRSRPREDGREVRRLQPSSSPSTRACCASRWPASKPSRLLAGELDGVEKLEWHASVGERRVPVPAGWLVGTRRSDRPARDWSNPGSAGTAVPVPDFTVALRAAIWPSCRCGRAGRGGDVLLKARLARPGVVLHTLDWLGVPYAIEGVFVRAGAQVLQLEVIGPEQRSTYARALLAAWAKRLE